MNGEYHLINYMPLFTPLVEPVQICNGSGLASFVLDVLTDHLVVALAPGLLHLISHSTANYPDLF